MNSLEMLEQEKAQLKSNLDHVSRKIKQIKSERSSINKEAKFEEKFNAAVLRERKLKKQNKLLLGMLAKHLSEDGNMAIKDIAEMFGLSGTAISSKIKYINRATEKLSIGYTEDCFND